MDKQEMYEAGVELLHDFCRLNKIKAPKINAGPTRVNSCAYWRPPGKIQIEIDACAKIGRWGPAWSYPGYVIDRTPYGVLQHELGHHVDYYAFAKASRDSNIFGNWWMGDFGAKLQISTGEAPISGYAPNPAEWFAEMFRLFVTNPDLLRLIRPKTYAGLRERWEPVVTAKWRKVLKDAPERTVLQAEKKIKQNVQIGFSSLL